MLQRQAFAYGAIGPVKYDKKPQNVKANQKLVWCELVINTKTTGSLGNIWSCLVLVSGHGELNVPSTGPSSGSLHWVHRGPRRYAPPWVPVAALGMLVPSVIINLIVLFKQRHARTGVRTRRFRTGGMERRLVG